MRCGASKLWPTNGRRLCRPRPVSLFVSIALVASGVFVAALPAGATPVWSVTPSPNPTTSSQSHLSGVSCPSTTFCIAVGEYTYGPDHTLVEQWNGTRWTIVSSPNPKEFQHTPSWLSGVSCPSTTSCFAVGSYQPSSDREVTLIEHWNGRSWSIMASPTPGDGTPFQSGGLAGVSCPSTSSCFAVGSFEGRGLIEHWNGSVWTIMNGVPTPPNGHAPLDAVYCPSPRSCFAVGSSSVEYADFTSGLVEHWNGRGGWSIMAGDPSPGRFDDLSGVSCPSPKSCFAVGASSYVEHWNGHGGWTFMTGPNPSATAGLAAVSCATTMSCVAIGAGAGYTLAEQWDGRGSWTIMTSPTLRNPQLVGVACPSTNSCLAVGSRPRTRADHYRTLVEQYA
jgi:hypothetical protein